MTLICRTSTAVPIALVLTLAAGSALAGTTGNHLAKNGAPPGSNANDEMTYSLQSMTNLDQNTVDMDRERSNFTDNTVRYEATLRFLNGQIKTLNTAITGQ